MNHILTCTQQGSREKASWNTDQVIASSSTIAGIRRNAPDKLSVNFHLRQLSAICQRCCHCVAIWLIHCAGPLPTGLDKQKIRVSQSMRKPRTYTDTSYLWPWVTLRYKQPANAKASRPASSPLLCNHTYWDTLFFSLPMTHLRPPCIRLSHHLSNKEERRLVLCPLHVILCVVFKNDGQKNLWNSSQSQVTQLEWCMCPFDRYLAAGQEKLSVSLMSSYVYECHWHGYRPPSDIHGLASKWKSLEERCWPSVKEWMGRQACIGTDMWCHFKLIIFIQANPIQNVDLFSLWVLYNPSVRTSHDWLSQRCTFQYKHSTRYMHSSRKQIGKDYTWSPKTQEPSMNPSVGPWLPLVANRQIDCKGRATLDNETLDKRLGKLLKHLSNDHNIHWWRWLLIMS